MSDNCNQPGPSIAGDISYHDYLAMLCFVDAACKIEHPQQGPHGLLLQAHHDFANRCSIYRDGIDSNYDKYCNTKTKKEYEKDDKVESFLFNPLCYQAIDRACNLDVVLLDDTDAAQHLAAVSEINIEDVYLAFCPELKSLQVENPWGVLCEFKDIFAKNSQGLEGQKKDTESKYFKPALHEFQKAHPLLAFTRYKMDGLGAIGQSMLFQQNLFKAMAGKINDVMEFLIKKSPEHDLITKDDLKNVKCVFLDLQGAEEVGTFIACNNYSVAMSIVAGIRSLTFGDLFDTRLGHILEDRLSRNKDAHNLIIRLAREQNIQWQNKSDRDILRETHAIRWTYTSLAVASEKFFKGEYSKCNGYIEALGQFKLSPGHRLQVQRDIDVFKQSQSHMKVLANNSISFDRYQVGRGDYIIPYGPAGESVNPFPVLHIQSFFEIFTNALKKFRLSAKKQYRDVVDIASYLTVPVPQAVLEDKICGSTKVDHVHPLTVILCQIQSRLCYLTDKKAELELKVTGPRQGLLDIRKLKDIPRLYGIPISLRRRVEFLYQSFAILIGDPHTFDLVLDLYDTFLTLHAILTKHLKAIRAKEVEEYGGPQVHYLDEGRIAQLSSLIDAIHNALMHRIAKSSYQDINYREMEIDFRGGLNQILMAADSPVKCGLGLARKLLSNSEDNARDRMGGLTLINSMPGARINNLNFGTEIKARLAYFEADVPHVLHPASYCDNLHESFHIIFDILWKKGTFKKAISQLFSSIDEEDNKEELPVMKKRVSEVFVNLMTHIFIFGHDKKTFLRHHLCSYSKSIQSGGRDDCGTMVVFTELLIRLFWSADSVPDSSSYPEQWDVKWRRENNQINDALNEFKQMVNAYGSYFSDYTRLWTGKHGDSMQEYCWKQFIAIYPKMMIFMPSIWSETIKIYNDFMKDAFKGSDCYAKYSSVIANDIKELSNGRPMIRSLYGEELDSLLLICSILHHYLKKLDDTNDCEIHLCREPVTNEVIYPKREKPWFEFQIDRGLPAMFCAVPQARRRRLRSQIAILKTFWDISSNLRMRRLRDIIIDNWPELSNGI